MRHDDLTNSIHVTRKNKRWPKRWQIYREDEEYFRKEKLTPYRRSTNKILQFKNRVYVPYDRKLWEELQNVAHNTPYSIHLGSTKMHEEIKACYWWPRLEKRDSWVCGQMFNLSTS